MKTKALLLLIPLVTILAFTSSDTEPWTKEQLLKPQDLASAIKGTFAEKPIIYNIGPAGNILGALYIGATQEKENLQIMEQQIQALPKDKAIVIYCGCCPFKDCPNIRPAFSMLSKKGFTNHKLLELPNNLKVDWIDKGYPMNK